MKKLLLSAVAAGALVAFGGSAWADVIIGVAGPITGPKAAFVAQAPILDDCLPRWCKHAWCVTL